MSRRKAGPKSRRRVVAKPDGQPSHAQTDEVVHAMTRIVEGRNDSDDLRHVLSVLALSWFKNALEGGDPRELKIADILHRVDAVAATAESRKRSGTNVRSHDDDETWFEKAASSAALTPRNRLWSECREFLINFVPLLIRLERAGRKWAKTTPNESLADLWLKLVSEPLPEHRDVLRAHVPDVRFANEGAYDLSVRERVAAEFARVLEAKRGRKSARDELEESDAEEIITAGLRALGCDTKDLMKFAAVADKRAAVK